MDCRCLDCGAGFKSETDADLCPRCRALEDRVYQNNPGPYVSTEPREFSRAAMRERLGVTGDDDV